MIYKWVYKLKGANTHTINNGSRSIANALCFSDGIGGVLAIKI